MKVLNIGSLNLDYVYSVPHFVAPGETLSAGERQTFCGGKGLNQSVAMAKAGLTVYHAGAVGADGQPLIQALEKAGVHTERIQTLQNAPSGHTVIQVDGNGQNAIIVYGGANRLLTEEYIKTAMEGFGDGDYLVLQNECNAVDMALKLGKEKGMQTVFNPSPWEESILALSLESVDWLIINELEGKLISGAGETDQIIPTLKQQYPHMKIVLTLGEKGSRYYDGKETHTCKAVPARAVDTTGAGDTFLGYFLQGVANGLFAMRTMKQASVAAAIAVSRKGAATAIPAMAEVERRLAVLR